MNYDKALTNKTQITMSAVWISSSAARRIQIAGEFLLRDGIVLLLLWIGTMKFTAYEAAAIQPLVSSSPLLGWVYDVLSVQTVSTMIGSTEILIALMIAAHRLSPRVAALGNALAAIMFATTLTFLFSLPGWEPSLGGFPALSPTGGFLVKDLVLLGATLRSLGGLLT